METKIINNKVFIVDPNLKKKMATDRRKKLKKNKMKKIIGALIILVLFSCSAKTNKEETNNINVDSLQVADSSVLVLDSTVSSLEKE